MVRDRVEVTVASDGQRYGYISGGYGRYIGAMSMMADRKGVKGSRRVRESNC